MIKSAYTPYLILMVLIATCLRLPFLDYGLPMQFYGDEWYFVTAAFKLFKGQLISHSTDYPSLYMYLVFLGYLVYLPVGFLLGRHNSFGDFYGSFYAFGDPYLDYASPGFYYSARVVSVLIVIAFAVAVFFLLKKVSSEKTALLTSFLFLLLPMEFVYSRIIKMDLLMGGLMVLSVFLIFNFVTNPTRRNWIWACIFSACAVCTKQQGMAILVPLFCAPFISDTGSGFFSRSQLRQVFTAVGILVVGLVVLAPNQMFNVADNFFLNIWNIFQGQVVSQGIPSSEYQRGTVSDTWYYFKLMYKNYHFAVLLVMLLGVFRLKKISWKYSFLWLSVILPAFFIQQVANFKKPNYFIYLSMLIFFFLFPMGWEWVSKHRVFRRPWLYGSVVLVLLLNPAYHLNQYFITASQRDTRELAQIWIQENVERNAVFAREIHYTPHLPEGFGSPVIEEWRVGKYTISDLREKNVGYVMISGMQRGGFLPGSEGYRNYKSYFDSLIHLATFKGNNNVPYYNPDVDIFKISDSLIYDETF